MKLIFKQKMFSWLDSYDIYDGYDDSVVFTVKGQPSIKHCFKIFDKSGSEVGTVKQKLFTFFPKFELYNKNDYIGCINREFSFFKPKYNIDFNGWHVKGDWFLWDYQIVNSNGVEIATISKQLFKWTDTYAINVYDSQNALNAIIMVIAIDAEKCSRRLKLLKIK